MGKEWIGKRLPRGNPCVVVRENPSWLNIKISIKVAVKVADPPVVLLPLKGEALGQVVG